jgi:hypothetical protein
VTEEIRISRAAADAAFDDAANLIAACLGGGDALDDELTRLVHVVVTNGDRSEAARDLAVLLHALGKLGAGALTYAGLSRGSDTLEALNLVVDAVRATSPTGE